MTLEEALLFCIRHRLVVSFRDMKRRSYEINNDLEYQECIIGVELWIIKRGEEGEAIFTVRQPIGLELSQDPEFMPQVFIRYVEVFRHKWKEQFGEALE